MNFENKNLNHKLNYSRIRLLEEKEEEIEALRNSERRKDNRKNYWRKRRERKRGR